MNDIEAIDDHVRLLAHWDELDRMIFVHNDVLEQLAGKRMNRAPASGTSSATGTR